jgi:hypothetical protein
MLHGRHHEPPEVASLPLVPLSEDSCGHDEPLSDELDESLVLPVLPLPVPLSAVEPVVELEPVVAVAVSLSARAA